MVYISGDTNDDALLQTTEEWTYRCTANLSQDTFNEALVLGYFNGLPVTDEAYVTVRVGSQLPPPLIHVVKTPNLFLLPFGGGKVTYTYEVSNPGVVALHYVQVTDDTCGSPRYVSGDSNEDNALDMDETWTYTCQSALTLTTTNTVTVTGNANNETAKDVASATVVVSPRPVVVVPEVRFRAAPILPPAPTPEVPLLPNTGVGPEAASIPWGMIASGLFVTCASVFATFQAKRHLSSKN
ncbi:MAG: hypothetical protein Q7S29_04985 [Candidatus Peribacter sp.]|nr:hypothetical protein [Candidatus Peribacter sp.]